MLEVCRFCQQLKNGPTLIPTTTVDGSDYRGVIRTVTFGPNENRECFNVPILNDQLDEGTELFSAEISSVPSDRDVIVATPDSATISILDDDGKEIL